MIRYETTKRQLEQRPAKIAFKKGGQKTCEHSLEPWYVFSNRTNCKPNCGFFVMESSINYSGKIIEPPQDFHLDEPPTIIYNIEKPPVILKPVKKVVNKKIEQRTSISSLIKVAPNVSTIIETPIKGVDDPAIDSSSNLITIINPIVVSKPRNIDNVEFVPIFPGCEALKTNEEKVACMSSKIGAFIQKKFRTGQFNNLDGNKIQRVYVQFKIDKNGDITNVVSRAKNLALKTEGSRVIQKLPRMIPGRQGDMNVDVIYMVPIAFKVE